MRLVVGSVLLVSASGQLWSDPPWQAALIFACLAGPAVLLVIGLWTPLAGIAVAAIEISRILTSDDRFATVLAATIGGALAMLGPGRWSIDARLFGWKRIQASPRRESPNSLSSASFASNSSSRAVSPATCSLMSSSLDVRGSTRSSADSQRQPGGNTRKGGTRTPETGGRRDDL
jgi:hypothetical protein